MQSHVPTSNFYQSVCWLGGSTDRGAVIPVGSSVVVHKDDREYLATALHVAEACGFRIWLRRQREWWEVPVEAEARDADADIIVFSIPETIRLSNLAPRYGRGGTTLGAIGRAMGFPTTGNPDDDLDYIQEADGMPLAICALVCAYSGASSRDPQTSIAAGYINQGFSGGAVLFSTDDGWTIAGIITHRLGVFTNAASHGAAPSLSVEPSGLFRYANWDAVEKLVADLT